MACQTKPPTGEKAPPRYVAPTFVPTQSAQTQRFIQSQLQAIQANLQALNSSAAPAPQTLPLQATGGTVQAREGDTVRVAPGATGVVVLLPTARAANKGKEITVLVESAGTVTVRAVDSQVQGVAEVTLSGIGLRVFRSDGGDGQELGGWWIVGQNSGNASNQLAAISAGTNFASTGTVVFSNSNGVTFGMNTGGVVTASTQLMVSGTAASGFATRLVAGSGIDIGIAGSAATIMQVSIREFQITINTTTTWNDFDIAAACPGIKNGDMVSLILNASLTINSIIPPDLVGFQCWIGVRDRSSTAFALRINDNGGTSFTYDFRTPGPVNPGTNDPFFIDSEEGYVGIGYTATSASWRIFYPFKPITGVSNANNVTLSVNSRGILTASATVASTQASIRISAGTTSVLSSGFTFSNSNNVSFGMNAGVVTASVTVATSLTNIRISAGTTSNLLSAVTFSNVNGVSFGLNASTITASIATSLTAINLSAGTTSNNLSAFTLSNSNNVSFGLNGSVVTASATVASTQASINISAGTTSNLASAFTFANLNGLSFGLNAGTITGSHNGLTTFTNDQLGLVSVVGGDSVASVTRLAFSNASNVTWSLSTAAGAATVLASVAAGGGGGITGINLSAGTTSNNLTAFTLSNSNNLSFGLNGSVVTGQPFVLVSEVGGNSVNATRIAWGNALIHGTAASAATVGVDRAALSIPAIAAGTQTATTGAVLFADSNNVTFGMSGSTRVTASVTVASTQASIRIIAGTDNVLASQFSFVDNANLSWQMSTLGGRIHATVFPNIRLSAGTTSNLSSAFTFSQDTGVSADAGAASLANVAFGLNAGTITGKALMRFEAGNASTTLNGANVTGLKFINGSGVTWGTQLTTDANQGRFMLVTASVAAGGGGGVALADVYGNTRTNGTVVFSLNTNTTISNLFSGEANNSNNVAFGFNGSTITAQAHIRVDDATAAGGNVATKVGFPGGANGISFSVYTTEPSAARRAVIVEGSLVTTNNTFVTGAASLESVNNVVFGMNGSSVQATALLNVTHGTNSTATIGNRVTKLHFLDGDIVWGGTTVNDANGRGHVIGATVNPQVSMPYYQNWDVMSAIVPVQITNFASSLYVSPFKVQPFPGAITADTLDVCIVADSIATNVTRGQFGVTVRGGVYTLNNSTRLSLLNSFSSVLSQTSLTSGANISSHNSKFAGYRWMTVGTGAWSSNPVFSQGVAYWFGLVCSVTGVGTGAGVFSWGGAANVRGPNGWMGSVNVDRNSLSAAASGIAPFLGIVSTGGIPNNIGVGDLQPLVGAVLTGLQPMFQIRDGLNVG